MRVRAAPFLAALIIMGLLGVDGAGAAPLPTITVDPGYGPPLTTVKIVGRSFCPGCGPVALSVAALNVDTAAVRTDGTFSTFVRIPGSTRPGSVTIAASQDGTTARTTFTVTVNRPAPKTYPPPKTLPPPGNLSGNSTTGTPAPTSASPAPLPTTAVPRPSSSTASISPAGTSDPQLSSAISPAAEHRASTAGSAWPIAALAAVVVLAAGALWWLRRRRG